MRRSAGLLWTFGFVFSLLSACKDNSSLPVDDSFREDLLSDINGFNILTADDDDQQKIALTSYETLLDQDPETYDFIPLLAKTYEISKDGMSFTFELDPNAKWADGQAVTSEDVVFSFASIFDPKTNDAPLRSYLGSLDSKVDVLSPTKFVVHAKTRHFKSLELISSVPMLPKHLLQNVDLNNGPMVTKTFGSGAYNLEEWKRGDSIVMKKNPNYWGANLKQNQGAFWFTRHIYKIVREPKIAIELLKQGFFTVYQFSSERWERDAKDPKIVANYDEYSFVNKLPKGYSFIGWNNKVAPFDSRDVRMALSFLLNRKFMIEKFTYGHALPAIGPIASTSIYAPKDLAPIPYDPQKAVELLTKAGWVDPAHKGVLEKGGKRFEFSLMYANPDVEKYLTVYKEDLSKVGIVCNLKRVDWTTFTKLLDDKKFESAILSWTASVHPDLYQIWHSDGIKGNGSNFVSYSNPKVDKLILEAQKEFNVTKRIAMNQDLSRMIANDAPYTFFMENPTNFVAARKGVHRPKDFMSYSLGRQYWTVPNFKQ